MTTSNRAADTESFLSWPGCGAVSPKVAGPEELLRRDCCESRLVPEVPVGGHQLDPGPAPPNPGRRRPGLLAVRHVTFWAASAGNVERERRWPREYLSMGRPGRRALLLPLGFSVQGRSFGCSLKPGRAQHWADGGAEVAVADLGVPDSLAVANKGVNQVVLQLPLQYDFALHETYGRNAVDAAEHAGVELVVFNTSAQVISGTDVHAYRRARRSLIIFTLVVSQVSLCAPLSTWRSCLDRGLSLEL